MGPVFLTVYSLSVALEIKSITLTIMYHETNTDILNEAEILSHPDTIT